jgi:hypothetical protein
MGLFSREKPLGPPEVRVGLVLLHEAKAVVEDRSEMVLGFNSAESQAEANKRLMTLLDEGISRGEALLEKLDATSKADRDEAFEFRSKVNMAKMQIGASPEALQKLSEVRES